MTTTPPAPATTRDDLERLRAARREEAFQRLGPTTVAWLVLVPAWSDLLAKRTRFPTGERSLSEVVADFERRNWALRRPVHPTGVGREEAVDLLRPLLDELGREQEVAPSPYRDEALGVLTRILREFGAEPGGPSPGIDAPVPAGAGSGDRGDVLPTLAPERLVDWLGRHLADATPDVLAAGWAVAARESDPRTAARGLVAAASRLPSDQVGRAVSTLANRVRGTGATEQTTVAHLAAAAASAGRVDQALGLTERLGSERLVARTLSSVAAALASTPEAGAVPRIVQRLLEVLYDGQDVDLPAAAYAVDRLVEARVPESARPVLEQVRGSLARRTHRGAEVGALVRLAAADGPGPSEFTRAALKAARAEGDPAIRTAALVQVLRTCDGADRPGVLHDASQAARAVVDEADRAHALARLVPVLAPEVQADVLGELVALCAPDRSTFAFWAVESARAELVEHVVAALGPDLLDLCGEIGRSLLEQRSATVTVPAATLRWATLAAALSREDEIGERAGALLLETVRRLLASGATGEALGWTEVAGRLVPVVHGTFETSVLLANRRIEVEQRTQRLRADLHRFLRRDDLVAAFDRLLAAPDDGPWALHYLGHGGVGKTTLLRYLAADLAPSRGRAVAWVDFDRLSPDFPATRPGQLLLDLLEDLEGDASGETSRAAYEQARAELTSLQWWVPGGTPAADRDRAVAAFGAFLTSVDRPVVLVLDTCEELTKFQPPGAGQPQVDAAFDLVEQVHARVPSVRVVFAGRRPLVARGAGGWVVDEARRPASVPERKGYLQVHEVAGFTEAEATTYLTSVENLTLEPDALARVLDRCRDPLVRGFGRDAGEAGTRYSPFDLALTAVALREDPEYAMARPRGDVYLETRVQRRLGERWSSLLPVVTVLRRFDRPMLGCAVDQAELDDAWQELQATEWTSTALDQATGRLFLEVDAGLLVRLDAHYGSGRRRPELDAARARLAQPLADLLGGPWRDDPPVEAVEAALRAAEPASAALLVADLMLLVAGQGRWPWAFSVCGRLLGAEGVLADPGHPAAPAARTLYGVAHARTASGADLTSHWKEVAARAGQHPGPQLAQWLRVHALLLASHGAAGALRDAAELIDELIAPSAPGSVAAPDRAAWSAWLLGTCLTEVDELAGRTAPEPAEALLRLAEGFAASGRRPLGALALVAAAELVPGGLLPGDGPPARSALDRAVDRALEWCGDAPPGTETLRLVAADHPGLRSIRHRVRLHVLRHHPLDVAPPSWLDECLEDLHDADADRLAGLVLQRLLDRAPVPAAELDRVTTSVASTPPPPSTAAVHAGLPPLRVVLARAWAALGEDHRARTVVGKAGRLAPGTPEQLALDVARVEVVRRFRMADKDRRLRASLRSDHRPAEIPRVIETNGLLVSLVPDLSPDLDAADLHVLWRASSLPDRPLDQALERAARGLANPGAPGAPEATALTRHLQLDLVELRLSGRASTPDTGPQPTPGAVLAGLAQDRLTAEERIALVLRATALATMPAPRDALRTAVVPATAHPRMVAEIALAEGELLALRLPRHAVPLLEEAADRYRESADPVGALLATVLAQLSRRRAGARTDVAAIEAALTAAHRMQPLLPATLADLPTRESSTARNPAARWWDWLDRIEVAVHGGQHGRRGSSRYPGSSPELGPQPGVPPPPVAGLEGPPSPGTWGEAYRKVTSSLPPTPVLRPMSAPPPVPQPPSTAPTAWAHEPAAPTTASASPASPRASRRTGRAVGVVVVGILLLLAVVGGLAGLVVLLYRGLRNAAEGAGLPGAGNALVTVPVFVALLVLVGWALARVATSGPAKNRLTVTLREHGGDLTVVAGGWRERRFPLPRHRARVELSVPMLGAGDPTLPQDVARRDLMPLAHATEPLVVAVDASLRLTGTGWERVLGDWLQALGPIRVHRVLRGGSTRPYAELTGRVVLATPPRWTPALTEAIGRRGDWTVVALEPGPTAIRPGDVAVLVGAVVGERAGSRIAVPGRTSGDLVVEPDEVGDAAAVLVCGLPTTETPDRRDTARLRRCAADVVLSGCPTAVVLPALPPELLRRSVEQLLERLERHDVAYPRQLADRVQHVRDLLAERHPDAAVEVTELRAR